VIDGTDEGKMSIKEGEYSAEDEITAEGEITEPLSVINWSTDVTPVSVQCGLDHLRLTV
jgi:hypothetical protein